MSVSADTVLPTYRLRCQIALAFRRLKSLLHIDRLPPHIPVAWRGWLLADPHAVRVRRSQCKLLWKVAVHRGGRRSSPHASTKAFTIVRP